MLSARCSVSWCDGGFHDVLVTLFSFVLMLKFCTGHNEIIKGYINLIYEYCLGVFLSMYCNVS